MWQSNVLYTFTFSALLFSQIYYPNIHRKSDYELEYSKPCKILQKLLKDFKIYTIKMYTCLKGSTSSQGEKTFNESCSILQTSSPTIETHRILHLNLRRLLGAR